LVEQQKTDVAEESTTSVTPTKTNIKEKIDEGDILKTEKDQDNACICTGRRGFRRIKGIKRTKNILISPVTGNENKVCLLWT
jgi:hypothetical protein